MGLNADADLLVPYRLFSCFFARKQFVSRYLSRLSSSLPGLVPYSWKYIIKNKESKSTFSIKNLNIPPDSERRETFEALIPALKVIYKHFNKYIVTNYKEWGKEITA